ncbi:MAG: type II secretion system F family protein [Nitrospirota bacterium]|jgi:type II secretory pathway component PulF
MPTYKYEAADRQGKKVTATAEAGGEADLLDRLNKEGLVPIKIKRLKRKESFTFSKISSKDLLVFTQELGNLLESGLPIDRAIYVLSQHSGKPSLRAILEEVYVDVQRGQSLSQAMAKHKIFPRVYVNMVRAGELGGILEAVIRRLASFMETSVAFKEELTSALIYPLLLTCVGGLAVAVLMIYVIPQFAKIFEDMGQSLPTPTLVLLAISHWFVNYWWALAVGAVGAFFVVKSYARTSEGRLFIDGLKLRTPVVRNIHMKLVIARFSRTLGTLLQSGVPVLEAIRVSREVVGNEVVSEKLASLEEGVSRGRGIYAPLRDSGVFPPIVSEMIAVGEEAGRLEETFLVVADRFEAESTFTIKRAASLLEPLMILFMGLLVGFIVISMLIAVFSINDIPI